MTLSKSSCFSHWDFDIVKHFVLAFAEALAQAGLVLSISSP
jgi:hypothetical protein